MEPSRSGSLLLTVACVRCKFAAQWPIGLRP